MSWLYIALLALAVAVVVGAEWPRLEARLGTASASMPAAGVSARSGRRRCASSSRRDADDFAASVERDLANLPTTEDDVPPSASER